MSRNWRLWALTSLALLSSGLPAVAQEDVAGSSMVITPADGVTIEIDGRVYQGAITVRAGSNGGLAVIEETTVDRYLMGIAEVPFSWPVEALRAQAIAARTYLAWTLDRGRSSNGRRYGYDICATDQCQVYKGLSGVRGVDGDRWELAVVSTGNQILLDGGDPLQALYSSTSGGRTRSVEDVFGSAPNPYLTGVSSPDEDSPFVNWQFTVEFDEMEALAEAAGHVRGELLSVRTMVTDDGEGPWTVEFIGTDGEVAVPTWNLRTDFNRAARNLFPDRFPVVRPDREDRRYPQTIMSPSFQITESRRLVIDGNGPPRYERFFVVRGNGWGHLVGMSQYGAEAQAAAGNEAGEILSHYYGGLTPQVATDVLPPTVRVGLSTTSESVTLTPDGEVDVVMDGESIADRALGTWVFASGRGSVLATPPVGLGLPPEIDGIDVFRMPDGSVQLVSGRMVSAGQVRYGLQVSGQTLHQTDWILEEAGVVFWIPPRIRLDDATARIFIETLNANGSDRKLVTVVPGAS